MYYMATSLGTAVNCHHIIHHIIQSASHVGAMQCIKCADTCKILELGEENVSSGWNGGAVLSTFALQREDSGFEPHSLLV